MRREYYGGQNARDWRRKVAALARRQKESVFTYKFKLDVQDGDIDFDTAARTYDVTEGIARGSLIGLVCAIHLSGFRLFSKEVETRQFVNRRHYPEAAFAAALTVHAKITNPAVTVRSIEKVLTTSPQSRGGVERPWSADELTRRLFQDWNNRSPKETEKDQPELSLAKGIASEVTAKFSGWKYLADAVEGALACADEYFATLGDSFPKIGALPPVCNRRRGPSGTLAHDPESPFVDMDGNEAIWLHQVVAVCAGRLQRDMPGLDPTSSKFAGRLNGEVVTSQNNGLSWLFGKGLCFLRQSSIEHLVEALAVPHTELRRVEQLKVFADAIPVNPIFETDGYAEFRGSVGGKIASWVSNYWKRICQLTALYSQPPDILIPERLTDAENASLFSGQHTDVAGLVALSDRVPERVQEAGAALAILRGGDIPGPQEIETIDTVASELTELRGQFAMLDNRLEQERESAEDEARANRLESLKREFSKELKKLPKLPKLNRISGGTDDARGEIQRLETRLNGAMQGRREHFRRLTEWVGGAALDPFPALEERERKALSDRKIDSSLAAEYALRRLLHRIAAMSRRLSSRAARRVREAMTPIFLNEKEANRYFHNRSGAIYRHPFSTSRHQAYGLDMDRARAIDWLAWLEQRAAEIRKELRSVPDANHAHFRDLLLVEEFVFTTRLAGLPDSVPGHLARPATAAVDIPPLLAAQLDAETVPRNVAVRAFNLFNSDINGLSFRAFRDSFIVRAKFLRLDHEELFYVPKDRPWQPPADYSSAKGEIAKGLALPAVVRDQTIAVLPRKTVEGLSKANFPEPGSRALLRQAPHDWFVELNLRSGTAPRLAGLPVKKNATDLKRWRPLKRPAFRLVGPPSFKTWLDRTLTETVRDKDVKLGDYTLLLDRVFKQSLKLEGENVRLSAEPVKIRAELAVPVVDKRPYPETKDALLFDNIVAIDLGERRIGYAIFSLKKFVESGCRDPFEVGSVAIPTFRKLQAAVRRHRGSRQPNQKVGQTYSNALMQFRENIVGDVCNRIETLCERFRGFPILERSVGNFESGGRQLEMIYGSVLRRYVYSEVDAHKTIRRQHWFTADTWEHPYIYVQNWNTTENQYSGPSKPLRLFPGIKVNPAGTSQTCHRCGRNALQELRNMPDKIEVGESGHVALKNGTIRLLNRADYPPNALKNFRHRKERPPLNVPISKGTEPRHRVESIAKRNMRQPPASEMSSDTTQSRFRCVYLDCGFEGHADENASINIGRRFFERIDSEKSRRDLTQQR